METIITLFVLALILFVFEIFIPGGLLAIAGGFLLLAATVVSWFEFGLVGAAWTFLASLVVGVGFVIFELTMLPRLPIARKYLFHQGEVEGGSLQPQGTDELIGKTGVAATTMAPTGTVRVEERSYEAFSQTGYVAKGDSVEVVESDAFRLVVKRKS